MLEDLHGASHFTKTAHKAVVRFLKDRSRPVMARPGTAACGEHRALTGEEPTPRASNSTHQPLQPLPSFTVQSRHAWPVGLLPKGDGLYPFLAAIPGLTSHYSRNSSAAE